MLHKIACDLFVPDHFAGDLKESLCGPRRLFFFFSSIEDKQDFHSQTLLGSLQNQEDFGVIS